MNNMACYTAQDGHALRDERIEAPLLKRIAELEAENERLKTAVPKNTKRDSEYETKDDWRHKAAYYESQWAQCSHMFNKVAGDLRARISELEKDAARYRFHVKLWSERHGIPEEDVVAELDAAMKEQA